MTMSIMQRYSLALMGFALASSGCVTNIAGGVNVANGAKVGIKADVNQGVQNEGVLPASDGGGTFETDAPATAQSWRSPAPVVYSPPSPQPSPTNRVSATSLRGKVYDVDNATVSSGARVTVKSLNPSNPFESTVDVLSGSYVVYNVPAGVQLEITASRTGWTSRTRVETLRPLVSTSTQGNIVNFGGTEAEDTEGQAYFLADLPEIVSVEPAGDAENVDSTKVSIKVTLSEPLDTTNQRRLAKSLRLFPANNVAAPGSTGAGDFNTNPGAFGEYPATGNARGLYSVQEGSVFMDDDATRATVTWDAAGQVATLTFNAPIIAHKEQAAEYQVALVSGGPDQAIADANGRKLGGPYEIVGGLVKWAFKKHELGDGRTWDTTHQHASSFKVAKDSTAPGLTGITLNNTRVALTFSEALGAYNGSSAEAGVQLGAYNPSLPAITPQANYGVVSGGLSLTFVASDSSSAAAGITMDGVPDVGADAQTGTAPVGKEFGIQGARLELNPRDPKTVFVYVKEGFFPAGVRVVRARVAKLTDPAGNQITEMSADLNTKVGTF